MGDGREHGVVMSIPELARKIGVTERAVRTWVNHAGLPVYPDGKVPWLHYTQWAQLGGARGYRRRCRERGIEPSGRRVIPFPWE